MMEVISPSFTGYAVFLGADHRRFWRIFTRRGWRHCFVMVPVYWPKPGLNAEQYTMIIDPRANCIHPQVVFMPPEEMAQNLLRDGATCVVKFKAIRKGLPFYVPRGVQNCVSVVKAVLGVAAWYVWTPQHLATWLFRNGGQLLEKETTS